jgi:anti-sigma regulatory factor (Ser/Thr protein kinase)
MGQDYQMALNDAVLLVVSDDSRIAEARRFVKSLAQELGFNDVDTERAAIVVTEAASNLMKHAQRGRLLIRSIAANGIEILALDNGPGIANISAAMQDGYTTASSKGIGLGAIARLSSSFQIYSILGIGTAIQMRFWSGTKQSQQLPVDVEFISIPKSGEKVNGDSCSVVYHPDKVFVLVADGLGHGPDAALSSQKAVETFQKLRAKSPSEFIAAIDESLKGTRGAALAVAEINLKEKHIRFAGIGNINAVLASSNKHHSMVSLPGIAGQYRRNIQEFVYPWENLVNPLLIMHSDGLEQRWNLEDYPGLAPMPLSLIAGFLFAKHTRGYDDVAVLVARLQTP